jgi:hypothetical protein
LLKNFIIALMKENKLLLILLLIGLSASAQKVKLKNMIDYTAFGMNVLPHEHLLFGGNHVFYKSIGMAISYRFGIRDFLAPSQFGTPGDLQNFDSVRSNNLFTNNSNKTYAFVFVPSFVVALTHKMPLYFGVGIARERIYREYIEKGTGEKFWIEDKRDDKILPTFTIGTFIPIYRRLLLNVAYDHLPQSVFIGISIRSWDAWDEFN